MTIKTRIAALAVAALAVAGGIASTTTKAEAHGFNPGQGFGARIVGAAIVDSTIAASAKDRYYPSYPSCLVRQYDVLGRYIGTVNICY
jgi:hypothetical protein